jgi:hypothetical protein
MQLKGIMISTTIPAALLLAVTNLSARTIDVPLTAQSWYLLTCSASVSQEYCDNKPDKAAPLSNNSAGDLQFTFPGLPGPNYTVNYLTAKFTQSIAGYSAIVMTVSTQALSGAPVFNYDFPQPPNTCVDPARVRPYIERKGDTGYQSTFRWWADDPYSYELDLLGNLTITVSLDPAYWSDVNGAVGSTNPQAFTEALANPMNIGMTFGGGCFFGHGVNVTGGTAQFQLSQYQIQ